MAFGMRIGLISDVHGNDAALKAVIGALQDRVELILFMGDLAGYYPFVDECVCQWDSNRMLGVQAITTGFCWTALRTEGSRAHRTARSMALP